MTIAVVRVQVPPRVLKSQFLTGFFLSLHVATAYILYSKSIDKYYTGSCENFNKRLKQHLNKTFHSSYTSKADDWEVHLLIENLNFNQARNIEKHIKSMKSRKYIQNLKKYPEMTTKLIKRFYIE